MVRLPCCALIKSPLDERLLAAAKTDNETLFDSVIQELEDVNYADGWVDALRNLPVFLFMLKLGSKV
jgi:hypothetical protein